MAGNDSLQHPQAAFAEVGSGAGRSPVTADTPSPTPPSSDSIVSPACATPTAIPDHTLFRCVGRGSYGEVWLARNVFGEFRAVKILHRHAFAEERPFEREYEGIQRFEPVSRSHPSQLAILHVGKDDAAGCFYYVMELADPVDGKRVTGAVELSRTGAPGSSTRTRTNQRGPSAVDPATYAPHTLRQELQRRGRLSPAECLEIGCELTTALAHLHEHGLVHRDIKPSNILFVGGVPKLGDIGLVADVGDTRSIVGTEGYLASEGPGTPAADIYSLGKVLYEISTGMDRREFPKLPDDLRESDDPKLLIELNEIVLKACAKDPTQRYRSAAEMGTELALLRRGKSVRWRRELDLAVRVGRKAAPIVAVAVLAVLLLPKILTDRQSGAAVVTEKASVFVLPFRNEEPNGVEDDLRGRITDAIIDSLAVIDGVRRSPRKSGWINLNEDDLRHALAKTNDMRHILTGRLAQVEDTVSLTLQLYLRGSEQPVWTESFAGGTNGIVEIERRAVGRLAAKLGLKISEPEQGQIDRLLTNNLEALPWFRQAWEVYQQQGGTQRRLTEVQHLAQRALDLDPNYVDAYYCIGYMWRNLAFEKPPTEVWPGIIGRMEAVLRLDDTYIGALDHMAGYKMFWDRDWEASKALTHRLLAVAPERFRGGTPSRSFYRAIYLLNYGQFEEARRELEKAEVPEPTNTDERVCMAAVRYATGRYVDGIRVARGTLELLPDNVDGYLWLPRFYVALGDYTHGIQAIQDAQKVMETHEMLALLGFAYARMGQPETARDLLRRLEESTDYVQPYFVARVYAALGEKDRAMDYLETAEVDKSEFLMIAIEGNLRIDPAWEVLQDEPRFWALCDKLGLGKDQWPRPFDP